jgi:voltage-gated potassium channel
MERARAAAVQNPTSLRDRFNAFVSDHEVAWELSMALLAVAFVATAFIEDPALEPIEWTLTGIFAAEFATRFLAARDRLQYLRGHWIDLIALVPAVRGVRLLRLLRLLRLVRVFAGTYRALGHLDRLVHHRGLLLLFTSWLAVMVICSLGLYLAERGAYGATVNSLGDALWWGITTLTTVGYGDMVPVTENGRIFASILMLLGIGLFAGITATVTSFILAGQASASDPVEQLRRLAELRDDGAVTEEEFAALKAKLIGQHLGPASHR